MCSSNYYSKDWKIDSVIPLRFHLFRCGQISTIIFFEGEMSIRDSFSPTHVIVNRANQILSVFDFILT